MGSTIGTVLPYGVVVALSPIPIIAVILMLFSQKARSNSLGFLVGWFLGVTVVAVLVTYVFNPAEQATGGESSPLANLVHLLLGLLLFWAAYRNWQKRPQPGQTPAMPKWMEQVDTLTPGKALAMGALLSGVNPKNLAMSVAAGVAIAGGELSSSQTLVALAAYVLVACSTVAAPVLLFLIYGDKASQTLQSWKAWLTLNNSTVMMVLCLVFGFSLIGKALGPLF